MGLHGTMTPARGLTMTVITRQHQGLRTYYYEDREINAIHFYRDGAVVLRTRSGWIEQESRSGRPDMPGLTIEQPIRRSTLINLHKGGHFYVASGKKSHFGTKQPINLYIDLALDDCAVGDEQDVVLYTLDSGVTYQKVRSLTGVFGDGERRTIQIASGGTYTVSNAYGAALAVIQEHLKATGMERSVTGVETIVKDRALLDLLLAAHQRLLEAKAPAPHGRLATE
jgi:hypothetical protein